jgi:hypothetical protein
MICCIPFLVSRYYVHIVLRNNGDPSFMKVIFQNFFTTWQLLFSWSKDRVCTYFLFTLLAQLLWSECISRIYTDFEMRKDYVTLWCITQRDTVADNPVCFFKPSDMSDVTIKRKIWDFQVGKNLHQPCPTRRPRCTFLAPSVSTVFEPIININSNFKTKTFWNVWVLLNIFTLLLLLLLLVVVVVVVVVVWWRPHLDRH